MLETYGIPTAVTALAYAVAAACGIFLFLAAGRLGERFGAPAVFRGGVALRFSGFLLLALPFGFAVLREPLVALCGFFLVMLAWPVLSVSATALAAELTNLNEGTAIGLLNASGALSTALGTVIAGPLVGAFGLVVAPLIGLAGLALAEALMMRGGKLPTKVEPAASGAAARVS